MSTTTNTVTPASTDTSTPTPIEKNKIQKKIDGFLKDVDTVGKTALGILALCALVLFIMLFFALFSMRSETVTGGVDIA